MKRTTIVAALAVLLAAIHIPVASAHPGQHAGKPANDMTRAAAAFMQGLSPEQKKKAAFAFDSDERENWHFVPLDRKGIMLSELSPALDHYAYALLGSGLSQKGLLTATTIMSLEAVLAEMENDPVKRDTEKYYLAIFGTPKAKGTWGWRFEGHHLSLNYTIVDGEVIPTPAFFGTNPARVTKGARKGTRPLGRLEDHARMLAESLREAGEPVVFSGKAPRDILTSQDRTARMPADEGVRGSAMNDEQKKMLLAVIRELASHSRPELAVPAMKKISEGIDGLQFAWAGGIERGDAHYFRIVGGDVFLIEYANTQNEANHAHAVWRLFKGDFGRDLLAEHFADDHAGTLAEKR